VLDSDIERTYLLNKKNELTDRLQNISEQDISKRSSMLLAELDDLQQRMEQINIFSAKSRAASILAGLNFSESMQNQTTSSLSGGWRCYNIISNIPPNIYSTYLALNS
jgi:ATP-binding cassette subfamily F protein 3